MCGIIGMVGVSAVNQRIYDALTVLQHRGQDAAGIMTSENGELFMRKDSGLVRDVFQQKHMLKLKGNVGIGHVRYPTAGADSANDAQPFYVNSPYGICLGHNGNLTNARELTEVLVREDRRHLNTGSDSEVLLNVLASELQRVGTPRVTPADIFAAANAVYRRCRGGYAVVAMVIGHGVLGFRDPNGIRPLVIGKRGTKKGTEWMLASESVALDMLGFDMVRDVAPGEAVFIDEQGRFYAQQCVAMARHTPCIFEYVYFARPDSIIDTPSSTIFPCTRRDCAWASAWPRRSSVSAPTTTSTWSFRFPIPAAPAPCRWRSFSGSSIARDSSRIATSAAPSSCRARSSVRSRYAAS